MANFLTFNTFFFFSVSLGWILDGARLLCQNAAKDVASPPHGVGEVSLCAGNTAFMDRKLLSLLRGFLIFFKGVSMLSYRKLKLDVNRGWRKEAGRILYKIQICMISGKTK